MVVVSRQREDFLAILRILRNRNRIGIRINIRITRLLLIGRRPRGIIFLPRKAIGAQNRHSLGYCNVIPVVIGPAFCTVPVVIPTSLGGAHTDPFAVNANIIVHRELIGTNIGTVGRTVGRRSHQAAHHREAILGVGEAGGAVPAVLGIHLQDLQAVLRKVDGLTFLCAADLNPVVIGDGHRHRGLRLINLAVQLEPHVKEPGEHQRLGLGPACGVQGLHRLGVIFTVFLGVRQDLLRQKGHALGQAGLGSVNNADGVIPAGIRQLCNAVLRFAGQSVTFLTVQVLRHGAQQRAGLRTVAAVAMEMLRQAAASDLSFPAGREHGLFFRGIAGFRMDVLFQTAAQHRLPLSVLRHQEAPLAVHVLLHLQQAADARTVSIKASLGMNMGSHFR